ncbi:hypothetical protein CVS37_12985 [Burkholderia lata]|nr:hypothetical protein CVS37_12985 [Burkholderia lata]
MPSIRLGVGFLFMAPRAQAVEPPQNPARFSVPGADRFGVDRAAQPSWSIRGSRPRTHETRRPL